MLTSLLFLVVGAGLGAALSLLAQRLRHERSSSSSALQAWGTIAVPLVSGPLPYSALTTAARLGRATHALVVLLAVVQVPRTISMQADAPPGLDTALGRLDSAERVVREFGAEVHGEVVRVREIRDLVRRACEETGAQVVVVEPNAASQAANELVLALAGGSGPRNFDVVLTHGQAEARVPA
jgi:hypothetical protein